MFSTFHSFQQEYLLKKVITFHVRKFAIEKVFFFQFLETTNDWKTSFRKIRNFKIQRILIF